MTSGRVCAGNLNHYFSSLTRRSRLNRLPLDPGAPLNPDRPGEPGLPGNPGSPFGPDKPLGPGAPGIPGGPGRPKPGSPCHRQQQVQCA